MMDAGPALIGHAIGLHEVTVCMCDVAFCYKKGLTSTLIAIVDKIGPKTK